MNKVRATILQGDVLERLRKLKSGSVNLIVTSPPYFNARMYCEDAVRLSATADKTTRKKCKRLKLTGVVSRSAVPADLEGYFVPADLEGYFVPAEIGMEATPTSYLKMLVRVFREAKRVLRDDGSMYINIGDSYCSINGFERASARFKRSDSIGAKANTRSMKTLRADGFLEKSLFLLPWRLGIALHDELRFLIRAEIIWYKPNAQPSVVKDRVSTAHETILHCVKRKQYFYDYEGSLEPGLTTKKRNRRSVWEIPVTKYRKKHIAPFPYELAEIPILSTTKPGDTVLDVFSGSGTTGIVALALGRSYIGIELNPESVAEQKQRLQEERFNSAEYTLKWKKSKRFASAVTAVTKCKTKREAKPIEGRHRGRK